MRKGKKNANHLEQMGRLLRTFEKGVYRVQAVLDANNVFLGASARSSS